ncbi:exopolysaccharide biosynthesis polyprenyl glycosylphosphotransferase [Flavobacterium sp. NRK F10]|uniref:exopolysaccharide biosynthesis polyprenyl glycosylphosphotransferase n=1 Tax=Flavobacterium sp. NRK F10 TaxID=2954931 RepID=UPI002091BCB0|nr:exopolysaccharide biosynthesis polyprenyl glycosylphosphotransferase [Flavobacterium sp. NRK F10]MCO6174161.1 exopolysaccharide biosynthesis polyprenyl glycosylphosphotransferase [Flavobacterium sp. NRK F10]
MHFEISERKVLLRIFDIFFVFLFLQVIGNFFEFDYFSITVDNYYWAIVLAIYLTTIGTIFEMYNLQIASNRYQIIKSIVLTTAVTTLIYLLTPFYTPVLPSNRLQIILFFVSIFTALLVWRYLYIQFLASNRFYKNVIFVGNSKKIEERIKDLVKGNPHYIVRGFVATDDKQRAVNLKEIRIDELERFVYEKGISEVVVTNDSGKSISVELYDKLLNLLEQGIVIKQYADVYESATYRLPIHFDNKELYRFFPFSRSNQNKLYLFYTRFFDIVMSVLGLLGLLFLLPFISMFNLIGNRGPLFYKQERIGRNGEPFKIVKLRTMVVDAEKHGAVFARVNDARITPIGKLLRKSRLDEVPQFINVLKGEMAIIGPRPERPVFVEQIAENIPLYKTRHVIKPGLTGWAQVNYPYGENLEDSLMKLRYDLYYIKHRSLFLDINIVVKTLSTVLFFRGQ